MKHIRLFEGVPRSFYPSEDEETDDYEYISKEAALLSAKYNIGNYVRVIDILDFLDVNSSTANEIYIIYKIDVQSIRKRYGERYRVVYLLVPKEIGSLDTKWVVEKNITLIPEWELDAMKYNL